MYFIYIYCPLPKISSRKLVRRHPMSNVWGFMRSAIKESPGIPGIHWVPRAWLWPQLGSPLVNPSISSISMAIYEMIYPTFRQLQWLTKKSWFWGWSTMTKHQSYQPFRCHLPIFTSIRIWWIPVSTWAVCIFNVHEYPFESVDETPTPIRRRHQHLWIFVRYLCNGKWFWMILIKPKFNSLIYCLPAPFTFFTQQLSLIMLVKQ